MKIFIQSTLAVAAVCLLGAWVCHESAVSPAYSASDGTMALPGGVQASAAAILTEEVMERLPEISSH